MRGRGSCWGGDEPWQADQIAAGHRQGELEAERSDATEHGSRKPTDRLAPTERLFDPLPLLLAHRVAGMPRGAAVDGRSPATDVLSDMRRHVERAHVGDKRRRVVTLVGPEGKPPRPGRMAHDHLFGRLALGGSGCLRQRRRDDEAVAVFHQRMAHEAELGFLATALAISCASGSVVETWVALLGFSPWKSRSPLRPEPGGSLDPSFALKPSSTPTPQSACHRPRSARPTAVRAVPGDPSARPGTYATSALSRRSRFFVNTVGTHWVVDAKPDEPAVKEILIELLHQLPLRPDRIKCLQQKRPQQPLRRYRRSAVNRIGLGKNRHRAQSECRSRHSGQGATDASPAPASPGPHTKQLSAPRIRTPHSGLPKSPKQRIIFATACQEAFFGSLPKGDDDSRGGQNRSPSPSPHGRTRMIVFPLRRSVALKVATASSRAETLPMFVRSRPSRTRWTISLSWARSDSTTKSTARPSAGRASVGPTMDTSVPPARIRPADRFWMSPPMTSNTRSTPPTSSSASLSTSTNSCAPKSSAF